MGALYGTEPTTPTVLDIGVRLQMNYIVCHMIRCHFPKSSFPMECIDLIVDVYLYQPLFDIIHKTKLESPRMYYGVNLSEDEQALYNRQHKHIRDDYIILKVSIIGDSQTGKTQLLLRYTANSYSDYRSYNTIGLDFKIQKFQPHQLLDGEYIMQHAKNKEENEKKNEKDKGILDKEIKMQIWDICHGNSRFRSCMSPISAMYRGTDAVIIVYDVSQRSSFDHIKHWNTECEKYASSDVYKILVGTKMDLKVDNLVSYDEAKELAEELNIPRCIETSAKCATNVDQTFNELAKEIYYKKVFLPQQRIKQPFYG